MSNNNNKSSSKKYSSFYNIFDYYRCFAFATIAFVLLFNFNYVQVDSHRTSKADGPIVGVLLQEQYGDTHQYVAASYVKFLEMAGARVVPIFVNRSADYYTDLLDQLNGVLMPGGGTPLIGTRYAAIADQIFTVAMQKFEQNNYFPIWATCLSFEKMITFFADQRNQTLDWVSKCDVQDVSLPLQFPDHLQPNKTRLLAEDDDGEIFSLLSRKNVTANYHRVCLTAKTFFEVANLCSNFTLISTNEYRKVRFVSTIEHVRYPFYGVAWHPEKPQFEWVLNDHLGHINHDYDAIRVGQYMGNFFVNEARKSAQHFRNKTEEADALIYNYNRFLVYSGKDGKGSFSEIYRFPINF